MVVSLVMFKADGTRREFPLKKPRTILGRTNACDLRIPLSSISRRHCELLLAPNQRLTVRDLGSSNGTFHNDKRVQEAVVAEGDRVAVGPVVFTVVVDGKPEQIQPIPSLVPREAVSDEAHPGETQEHRPLYPAASELMDTGIVQSKNQDSALASLPIKTTLGGVKSRRARSD